jgi:hypothetical protein
VHCEVALTTTLAGLQVTITAVIVGAAACTVTGALPDLVVSCVLVAVTIKLPTAGGAVRSPLELTVPLLADQVTVDLKLPVPRTVALHCDVPLTVTVAGEQATETDEMVDDAGGVWLPMLPPPQSVTVSEQRNTKSAERAWLCKSFLLKLCWELIIVDVPSALTRSDRALGAKSILFCGLKLGDCGSRGGRPCSMIITHSYCSWPPYLFLSWKYGARYPWRSRNPLILLDMRS